MLNGHLLLGQPTKAMYMYSVDFNGHFRQASLCSCEGKTNLEANVLLQPEGDSQESSATSPHAGAQERKESVRSYTAM